MPCVETCEKSIEEQCRPYGEKHIVHEVVWHCSPSDAHEEVTETREQAGVDTVYNQLSNDGDRLWDGAAALVKQHYLRDCQKCVGANSGDDIAIDKRR